MEKFVLFALGTVIFVGVIFFTADFLAKMYYSAIHTPNIKNIKILKKLILNHYTNKNKTHDFSKLSDAVSRKSVHDYITDSRAIDDADRIKSLHDYITKNNYTRRILVNYLNERGFSFGVYGTQHWLLEINKHESSFTKKSVYENIEVSILNEYSIDREDGEEKINVVEVKSIIFSMSARHFFDDNDTLVTIIDSIETVKGGNILFNSKK